MWAEGPTGRWEVVAWEQVARPKVVGQWAPHTTAVAEVQEAQREPPQATGFARSRPAPVRGRYDATDRHRHHTLSTA